ncbi:hypothetical protein GW16_07200 [Xanthomonas arboricola pv. celebensis]|nr:hypothetical protein GW16_07200 [Xanthomonas arboricola pv. celebensis]
MDVIQPSDRIWNMFDHMRRDEITKTALANGIQQAACSNDEVDLRDVLWVDATVRAVFVDQSSPIQMICVLDRMTGT